MAGISISGLGGFNADEIVTKLMQVENAPRARLQLRQGQVKAREDALREVSSKLRSVADAAAALRSVGMWADVQSVETSGSAVAARAVAGAGPGGYALEVTQLARAEQRTFDFTASPAASQLTINGETVALGAGASLGDAVAAINGNPETGVYAVAVAGQLVLSSRTTGAASTIAAAGAGLSEDAAKLKAGRDAAFSVDGVAGSSASNVIADAIPGLELTLKATTVGPVTVTVGDPAPDAKAIEAGVKAFVSSYNAALDAIRSRLTDPPVPNPASQAEANRGVLYGDSQLNGLLARLRGAVAESGVGALGVSTGAPGATVSASSDSVLGRLKLDPAKLTAALAAGPTAVRDKLADFADSLDEVLAPTLGAKGAIPGRLEAAASESRRLADSMLALNTRLERREERLHLQFAALESAMLRSQTQSSWLSGQLAQLAP